MSSVARAAWLIGLSLLACTAPDEAPVRSTVELVIGAGAACAAQVTSIAVTVRVDGAAVLETSRAIAGAAALPSLVSVDMPDAGKRYDVEVRFAVDDGGASSQVPLTMSMPGGSSGRVVVSLACACIGVHCSAGSQCAELPAYSGKTVCTGVVACGDGACSSGESPSSCPADCAAACGDRVCEADESCASCPIDCGACAGCEGPGCGAPPEGGAAGAGGGAGAPGGMGRGGVSGHAGMAGAAGAAGTGGQAGAGSSIDCGDGVCSEGEDCTSCPDDCPVSKQCKPASKRSCSVAGGTCPDGSVESCSGIERCTACGRWEGSCSATPGGACSCPVVPYCGDGSCDDGETSSGCPSDCPATCDPGVGASCNGHACACGSECDCPVSCDNPPSCGNGVCECGESCYLCATDCAVPGGCAPDTKEACDEVGGSCGQGGTIVCKGSRSCDLCGRWGSCFGSTDCACVGEVVCGDGTCDAGETVQNCPADCTITCGIGLEGRCGNTTCACQFECDCASICNPDATCGNGACECGETCGTCYADCGTPGGCLPGTSAPCKLPEGPCGVNGTLMCDGQIVCNLCGDPGPCAKSGGCVCEGDTCGDLVCCTPCGENEVNCPGDCVAP